METLCKIRDIYRLINEFEEQFQQKFNIGLNEGMLLCTICKTGQCTSGKIAELLGLTSSNSSKVIASVEKKGLIERIIGKEDKRLMYFSLTQKGRDCLDFIKHNSDDTADILKTIKEMS